MVTTDKTKSQENADKQQFKDLIAQLNFMTAREEENIPLREVTPMPKNKLLEGKKLDQNMSDIINRFNNMIEETVKPVLMEERAVDEFSLAIKTKPTENGVQVGDWEIVKIQEGTSISYDIANVENKKVILEDIKTYVAANAVVKLLNNGSPANGSEISRFLKMDEDFDMNYQDALRYGRRFKKTGQAVYEDRYLHCKGKALHLKETIKKNADMIGKL